MALLSVSLDTETKELNVIVDGVKVENVDYISLSNYACHYNDCDEDDKPDFHFNIHTTEKVGDVSKATTFCASKKENTVASTKYKGLFQKEDATASVARFDIKKFLPTLTK